MEVKKKITFKSWFLKLFALVNKPNRKSEQIKFHRLQELSMDNVTVHLWTITITFQKKQGLCNRNFHKHAC